MAKRSFRKRRANPDEIPDDLFEALRLLDDGLLSAEEATEVVRRLRAQPPVVVNALDTFVRNTYLVDDHIVEIDDDSVYMKTARDWVGDQRELLDEIEERRNMQFNDYFLEHPTSLFHATPSENIPSILKHGLRAESRTRGLYNRNVGAAIFTVVEPDSHVLDSYGDTVLRIDTLRMKQEGVLFSVEQEPPLVEAETLSTLAYAVGVDDYETDTSSDYDPDTVILHVAVVPPRYLAVVNK